MTTIDDRHRENSQQNEGDPTFTAADMSRQRNAEPTALHSVADTEQLRAAATRALRILERSSGLAPTMAAPYARPSSRGRAQRKHTERLVSVGRSGEGRSMMSDMAAALVAVVAFAVAVAARLAGGTETHSPESGPRHPTSLVDQDSGRPSVARRGDHP